MAFGGDDDRRGKRKMAEPHDKDTPWHGRGRTIAGNNSAAGRGAARDRGRRDQLIQEEENLERASHTISSGACPDTPPHLEEFDRGYIREYSDEVIVRRPVDIRAHPVLNYAGKQKMVEEASENNPFE